MGEKAETNDSRWTRNWRLRLVAALFFFQAEDGIRDVAVTGVQTCALPISHGTGPPHVAGNREFVDTPGDRKAVISPRCGLRRSSCIDSKFRIPSIQNGRPIEIGRASCRERV